MEAGPAQGCLILVKTWGLPDPSDPGPTCPVALQAHLVWLPHLQLPHTIALSPVLSHVAHTQVAIPLAAMQLWPVSETLVLEGWVRCISHGGRPPAPLPLGAVGHTGSLRENPFPPRIPKTEEARLGQHQPAQVQLGTQWEEEGNTILSSYPASLHLPGGHDNDTGVLLVHHGPEGSHRGLQAALGGNVQLAQSMAWLLFWVTLKGGGVSCLAFPGITVPEDKCI